MDDLTRYRHPYDIPWHEADARPPAPKRRPWPATPEQVSARRIDLAGTDDLAVQFAARGAP